MQVLSICDEDLNPDEIVVPGRDFIAPCKCKGSQKYVHRECLDNWRSIKVLFVSIFLWFFKSRGYWYTLPCQVKVSEVYMSINYCLLSH
jgi:hypothetical protein